MECLLRLVDGNIWRETFNIGGVESISIIELAHKIKEHTNSSSEIKLIEPQDLYNNQFVEIEQRTPDVSKLKTHIGTAPETSLDEMIAASLNFILRIQREHSRALQVLIFFAPFSFITKKKFVYSLNARQSSSSLNTFQNGL